MISHFRLWGKCVKYLEIVSFIKILIIMFDKIHKLRYLVRITKNERKKGV